MALFLVQVVLLSTVVSCLLTAVKSQNDSTVHTTSNTATSTHSVTSSTPSVDECQLQTNKSCDDCIGVSGAKCLYCFSDKSCKLYPTGHILPRESDCALDQARWGVCWVNFQALIIAVSVIAGVIVLAVASCCIYCCCCRGGDKNKWAKEDQKWEAQKADRKQKADERRSERKQRVDEIRRKYGLMKEDTPYQRFEA